MRVLVQRYAGDLAGRPVWLLSSGPVGDPPTPEDPVGGRDRRRPAGRWRR